jgi:hypothetical protein
MYMNQLCYSSFVSYRICSLCQIYVDKSSWLNTLLISSLKKFLSKMNQEYILNCHFEKSMTIVKECLL